MNWYKFSVIFGATSLIVTLVTACGNGGTVPPTPTVIPTTAIPTPAVQVAPSPTPLPPSPTAIPTRAVSPTLGTTRTPTFTPTPSPKDMAMAAFTKALANLKTYRVEVPQESRYVDVQLPDRFLQEGADSVVKIGGTLWRPNPKGGFLVGSGATPPYFERADINWYKQQFAQAPQVTLLGPGTAEGVACIGYSINMPTTKAEPPKTPGATPVISQIAMPVKIWFATTDGFPRRVDLGAPLSLTINFFDLNDNFTITPPR